MAWAPTYASTSELASFVRIGDTADDAQLGWALTAASRAIDDRAKRQFGQVASPQPREYLARWSGTRQAWRVPIDDLQDADGLTVALDHDGDGVHESEVPAAGYRLRPRNAVAEGRAWTELLLGSSVALSRDGAVQVTARWGWVEVPHTIKAACLIQASRLLARRDAPFGVAGSPEAGSEVRLLARVDPDVAVMVDPYRRRTWVA